MNLQLAKTVNYYLDKIFGIRIAGGRSRRPIGIEDASWSAIQMAEGRTMGSSIQQYTMWQAANYVEAKNIPGAIVEFGVWRGGMTIIAAKAMQDNGSLKDLYLFDTFDGMTEPTSNDVEMYSFKSAQELLDAESKVELNDGKYNTWVYASMEDVIQGMKSTGLPDDQIHYVPGDVAKTVPDKLPETIAVARLDTDWYESTKHLIECVWPRISPGGVLILDDYDVWSGARKAIDDYFADIGFVPFLIRPEIGRVVLKI